MRVVAARLDTLDLPLVEPFETSFGVERRRRALLLHLRTDRGAEGLAECVAARDPLYSSESITTVEWLLRQYLLPAVFRAKDAGPLAFQESARAWRGHPMAKATVEMALWDLLAQERERPLGRLLGGRRGRIEVGVSVGIQPDVPRLVRRVGEYLGDGYRRIKLKIRPRWDEAPVAAVRREHPSARLWVDANQAYRARDVPRLARLARRHRVEQVEQPFAERNLESHARLVAAKGFRVCLDESVVDRDSFTDAVRARAVTSLNVKAGRVGGLAESRALERAASRARIPAWVGGMLETGVGRAHNVHLATLPNFRLPGDLSASDRYYREEIVDPPFVLGPGSTLGVPRGPGIGVTIDDRIYRRYLRKSRSFSGPG